MTKLNHPKLTQEIISNFLKKYQDDQLNAKYYLGKILGVQKTQRNKWAKIILRNAVLKDVNPFLNKKIVNTCKSQKIRRLFWDIETSPNAVLSWRIGYKINLSTEDILSERKIICIGYKWEGEKEVHILKWDENQDDKKMLIKFLEVANEADEIVHHNGDSFDMPWFKTRCLYHKITTFPEYKTVDTLQWAKRYFLFNSNKMDYIAKYLGHGGKIKTGYTLWKKIVLEKCPESMKLMCEYCQHDVILLEKVWNDMRLAVKPKTHAGVTQGKEKYTCSHCGSEHVHKSKTRVSATGNIQHQMHCDDCGGYTTISDSAFKKYLDKDSQK
jgi:predicted PolB exonuclease-like 3'-5' exonuclease